MEAQVCALREVGTVRIFKDIFSSKNEHRPQLDKLIKRAPRLNDKDAVHRCLQQFYSLGGNAKSFKTSMKNMHPLHSLSKREQAQFLKWITDDDKNISRVLTGSS